jgi:hypothetical protein
VYDAAGELIALHVGGGVDWAFAESCRRADTVVSASERQQLVAAAVAALRASVWPSARLTGIDPTCGDGVCTAEEHDACRADCAPARCGDGLCEQVEHAACPSDCAAYAEVPARWSDDPEIYRSMLRTTEASGCALAGPPWLDGWALAGVALAFALAVRRSTRRDESGKGHEFASYSE